MKTKTKVRQAKPFEATEAHKTKKLKLAIRALNESVKIKLGASTIHGVGVFAIRDIKKGERLYADSMYQAFDVPFTMFGQLRPEISEQLLSHFPQIVNGSHFLYPVTRMVAFMNHADEPNYDAKEDKTLRKIKKGEEITEDYRLIDGYEKIFTWLKK